MEKFYEFAGVQIAVSAPEEMMYTQDRTLEPFRVKTVTDPYRFTFEILDALAPPTTEPVAIMDSFVVYCEKDACVRYVGTVEGKWETAYLRTAQRGKTCHVQLKRGVYGSTMSAKTVLNAISAEHLMAQNGGFVFHSSYIEVKGKAILFTAPSGTGKSTQAELWHTLRNARVINGDRSAVCIQNGQAVAAGIPFAGSSRICRNVTLPLTAIVYLSQAPQTTIRQLRGAEAFRRVWEGVSVNTWDKEDVSGVMDAVQQTVMSVPVYYLSCTPDETAVTALERVLEQ